MASNRNITDFFSPVQRKQPYNLPDTPSTSPEADTKTSHEKSSSGIKPGRSKHSPVPDVKREPYDESHTFQYIYETNKQKYTVSCYSKGTVLDALMTSDQFVTLIEKNSDKELVILREKHLTAAVCTHFPCHLIDNEEVVKVRWIRVPPLGKSRAAKCRSKRRAKQQMHPDTLITFYVGTTGGEKIKTKVIKNPNLKKKVNNVCVYAYKNEKVKEALRRDGRFNKYIFNTHCVLLEQRGVGTITEMSQLVDGLDGKTVQVKRIDNVAVPDSLEDWDNTPTEEPCNTTGEHPEAGPSAPNSTPPETGNVRSQGKEGGKDGGGLLGRQKKSAILNSEEIVGILRSQFAGLVEKMKEREKLIKLSDVQQFFRKEFGKKTQCFQEVKTMESLIEQSASVCQVRIEGKAAGTGFLLFDKFILTNAHVVEPIYEPEANKLQQSVTVAFDFKDLTCSNERHVETEVVVYGKNNHKPMRYSDFAVLELSPAHDISLPAGLLSNFSFPTVEGGVCLIGHPDAGVKKIDLCFIVSYEDRLEAVSKHCGEDNFNFMHFINNQYFNDLNDPGVLTYDTCFFHGSSGSPAFNEHCQVVAMHTGGYPYKDKKGKTQSVIEYAIPLSIILEDVLIQAVKRKRVDVLEGFLIIKRQNEKLGVLLDRVEVRSRNASLVEAFQAKWPSNSNISNPEEQRTFHQLLFEPEPVVEPMDVDSNY